MERARWPVAFVLLAATGLLWPIRNEPAEFDVTPAGGTFAVRWRIR